ncbi:MAG: PH domain-containing protein [Rhodococcus sp.]|nr:PH domain-containing protein [Rhodococcus sp. (in: high G+C Gram-positive bacteria)]
MSAKNDDQWELIARPRKSRNAAIVAAVFLVVVHVTLAILLRTEQTGVFFRLSDQLAMAGLGCVFAAGVLLLARPRLRVGPRGIAVRNVLNERVVDWDLSQGLSFPDGAAWARIELPDDEYISVMAIQSNDRDYAVDAVRRFRAVEAEYTAS